MEVFQLKYILSAGRLLVLVLVLNLALLTGCSRNEQTGGNETVSGKDIKKEAKEAYDTTMAYTQEQIQAFREQTKNKLAEYSKQIDQLHEKAEELEGDAKEKADQQLAILRKKYDDVSEKLKDLSSSGKNVWEQIKSGINSAMDDLAKACKKAAEEFNKS